MRVKFKTTEKKILFYRKRKKLYQLYKNCFSFFNNKKYCRICSLYKNKFEFKNNVIDIKYK